jgi:hypothetical protein
LKSGAGWPGLSGSSAPARAALMELAKNKNIASKVVEAVSDFMASFPQR